MFNNKKNIIYIAIVISIFILLAIFILSRKEKIDEDITNTQETTEQESEELTPEQVLDDMDDRYKIVLSPDASLSITSPKEETFSIGQARMWEGTLSGIENGIFKTNCKWEFYMNDELYRTRNNPSSASVDDNTTCGFTSTFINIGGGLEVKLSLDVVDSDGNVVDTFSADRKFTVL